MKKVGITGGIGSGKTTICQIFESLDIPIYYADIQAKRIMSSHASVKQQIRAVLGEEAYHANGKLNRKFIASKIFSDKSLLLAINQIVHPAVQTDADRWTQQIRADFNPPYIIREAALLVENGSYKSLDAIIVVTCPENIRIKRVMKRDRLSNEEVSKKIKSQMAESEKVKVADFVIVNDGIKPIIPQVWEIHKKISKI